MAVPNYFLVKMSFTKLRLLGILLCLFFFASTSNAQLANSNYGLRSKMGIALSHEISEGTFDYIGQDGDDVDLFQQTTNFQAAFPLILKIDTLSPKVKLNILKAEYTFRNIENIYTGNPTVEQTLLAENFYANSVSLAYLHTIGYPLMMQHSIRITYAGDYGDNNPLNLNASSFLLWRVNDRLMLGVGALYQQMEDQISFLVVPYMDWRASEKWFVEVTMPDRILVGRNFGKEKQTQLAWGTYIEFFTRFAFQQNGQNLIYENFDIASGLDFRTRLKGKLHLNAFVGNNFLKDISIKDNDLNELNAVSSNIGINARIGLSLNLED